MQGGSFTVSSVGTAVQQACEALNAKLLEIARQTYPVFKEADSVRFEDGQLHSGDVSVSLAQLVRTAVKRPWRYRSTASPTRTRGYASATHSAVFVEVRVDEDLGTIKVSRVSAPLPPGAWSTQDGPQPDPRRRGMGDIGMALHEETQVDHQLGRYMNHSLAEYHIPVNADIGEIDVLFVEEHDEIVNALGVRAWGNRHCRGGGGGGECGLPCHRQAGAGVSDYLG